MSTWVIKVAIQHGVTEFSTPTIYYSEGGWQSDVTHAQHFPSKDEAEKIAFSIVSLDPSKVGCVSVEEDPT